MPTTDTDQLIDEIKKSNLWLWLNQVINVSEVRQILTKHIWERKENKQEEMLLWEDLPNWDYLGCRIYGYVKDWVCKITRVEYTKHIKPSEDKWEEICKHESDWMVYASMPPKRRCKKCWKFYR